MDFNISWGLITCSIVMYSGSWRLEVKTPGGVLITHVMCNNHSTQYLPIICFILLIPLQYIKDTFNRFKDNIANFLSLYLLHVAIINCLH